MKKRMNSTRKNKARSLLVGLLAFAMATVSFQVMADLVMIAPAGYSVANGSGSFNINFDGAGGNDWGFFLSGDADGSDAGGGGGDGSDSDAGGGGGDSDGFGDSDAGGDGGSIGFVRGNSLGQTAIEFSIGTPLQLGDLISNSLTFESSPFFFQSNVSDSSTQFLGVRFTGDTGTIGPQYGWLEVKSEFNTANGQMSFDILDGAFENSGNTLQVGAVAIPEPSSILAFGLVGSSLLVLRRRRRHNRL